MKRLELKEFQRIKREIRQLRRIVADLEDVVAPVANWDGLPKGGGVSDKVGDIVAKRDELKRRYIDELHELLRRQKAIEEYFEGLEGQDFEIARCLFIEGKTWIETAECLNIHNETIRKTLNRITDK